MYQQASATSPHGDGEMKGPLVVETSSPEPKKSSPRASPRSRRIHEELRFFDGTSPTNRKAGDFSEIHRGNAPHKTNGFCDTIGSDNSGKASGEYADNQKSQISIA